MTTTQFETWLNNLNEELKEYHTERFENLEWNDLTYTKGRKFIKIVDNQQGTERVWGFVSMIDGTHLDQPIKKGDLLMAASWKTPARHSRGNIFDGTEQYGRYGPLGMDTIKRISK